MGSIEVIFELKDESVYEEIKNSGFFSQTPIHYCSIDIMFKEIIIYSTNSSNLRLKTNGCFISPNYQVNVAEKYKIPGEITGQYGPTYVFGTRYNDADYNDIKAGLEESLKIIETAIPKFRENLTYKGIFIKDWKFLFDGSGIVTKKEIEDILKENIP